MKKLILIFCFVFFFNGYCYADVTNNPAIILGRIEARNSGVAFPDDDPRHVLPKIVYEQFTKMRRGEIPYDFPNLGKLSSEILLELYKIHYLLEPETDESKRLYTYDRDLLESVILYCESQGILIDVRPVLAWEVLLDKIGVGQIRPFIEAVSQEDGVGFFDRVWDSALSCHIYVTSGRITKNDAFSLVRNLH